MLIIEDGTGVVPDTNSFATLEEADAYLVPRNLWPVTPVGEGDTPDAVMVAKKEAAMLRATGWLNTLQWKGRKNEWKQSLCWPRTDVTVDSCDVPNDEVPHVVALAQMEMSAIVYSGIDPLVPIQSGVASMSESTSEGLDIISDSKSKSITYRTGEAPEMVYTAAVGHITPLLKFVPGKSGGARFIEAGRG